MQDQKNEKKSGDAGFEKAIEPIHGIIARVHALEHPDWQQKDEDISLIKTTLARYASELEHLKYRYDARGAELEKIKAQYTELEHKFLMRPEAMRRVGDMDVTELVKKKHDLTELESSLERSRLELDREKERQAGGAKELVSARLAELEREYAGKTALADSREEKAALREKAVSEAEKNIQAQLEEARKSAVEELSVSFAREKAVSEGAFRREKFILTAESEKWRSKAEELQEQLAGAKQMVEDLESAAEVSREATAEVRQKYKLAGMENAAFIKRLEEWDKKGPEFEKWRSELAAREEKCARIEETARNEAQQLRTRIAALEENLALATEKHLKAEVQKDAERSGKMESLIAEMEAKERGLEENWTRRHTALEAEQNVCHAEFEKRHLALLEDLRARSAGVEQLYSRKEAKLIELHKRFIDEFQDREAKARAVEEELRGKAAMLAASSAELAREYEQKSSELEAVKREALAEISGAGPQTIK